MNKTVLNRMLRRLEDIKASAIAETTTDELQPHLDLLRQQIETMSTTLVNLRGGDSASTKINRWFENLLNTNEIYRGAFSVKANESKMKIDINPYRALGYNLKYEINPRRAECPEDIEAFRRLNRDQIMSGASAWFPKELFDPFISIKQVFNHNFKLTLEFKFSKRLLRDENEMNDILTAFITHLWSCCERYRTHK